MGIYLNRFRLGGRNDRYRFRLSSRGGSAFGGGGRNDKGTLDYFGLEEGCLSIGIHEEDGEDFVVGGERFGIEL